MKCSVNHISQSTTQRLQLVNGFLVNGLPYSTLENATNIGPLKHRYIMETFFADIVGFS